MQPDKSCWATCSIVSGGGGRLDGIIVASGLGATLFDGGVLGPGFTKPASECHRLSHRPSLTFSGSLFGTGHFMVLCRFIVSNLLTLDLPLHSNHLPHYANIDCSHRTLNSLSITTDIDSLIWILTWRLFPDACVRHFVAVGSKWEKVMCMRSSLGKSAVFR